MKKSRTEGPAWRRRPKETPERATQKEGAEGTESRRPRAALGRKGPVGGELRNVHRLSDRDVPGGISKSEFPGVIRAEVRLQGVWGNEEASLGKAEKR